MSETDYTTNRRIPYPTGKDFIPEGPEEMEAIANAVDAENRGEIDHLQAGVVKATDWNFVAAMESSSECKLESEAEVAESVAWLPLTAIGLVRSVTAKQKLKALKPPSLPGAGKYMTVGIEITPTTSDAGATVSVVSGVEKASQAEAEAASPAVTAGKARVRDVVILSTAGVYSVVSQLDRRRWAVRAPLNLVAQGASCTAKSGERVEATAAITVTGPTAPVAGDIFGVLANGHEVKIAAGSGVIYGGGVEGATSLTISGYQAVDLVFDGTNWSVVGFSGTGAYTNLTAIGGGKIPTPPSNRAQARVEGSGTVVRLKGRMESTLSGSLINLASLPVVMRPPYAIFAQGYREATHAAVTLEIDEAGEIGALTTIAAGECVRFDGITFPLT